MIKTVRYLALCVAFLLACDAPLQARELTMNNELFVEIEELIVPIIQRRDVAGFFSVILAVDCKDLTTAQKVAKYLPIIRDRLFWDLYVLLGVIWSPDFRTDLPELKNRLKRRLENIMGKDVINDVLVISFQEHQRRNVDF